MSGESTTVLIVEDEVAIRRFIRAALEAQGYIVTEADTIGQALIKLGAEKPDVVILDLGLPDGDGTHFVRELRIWSHVPVLVLSARASEKQKIEALDAGADDYLTKPFAVGELLARARALVRRAATHASEDQSKVCFSGIEVDLGRRLVFRDGVPVHLTAIEYRLMCVFIASAGKVMTHRMLLREVWGPAHSESSHYLRIYVSHLRQKLEIDSTQPKHFQTEIGVGYRFQL
jgi:two-component system, OmpR family, KDP operon response regulator KdpE